MKFVRVQPSVKRIIPKNLFPFPRLNFHHLRHLFVCLSKLGSQTNNHFSILNPKGILTLSVCPVFFLFCKHLSLHPCLVLQTIFSSIVYHYQGNSHTACEE